MPGLVPLPPLLQGSPVRPRQGIGSRFVLLPPLQGGPATSRQRIGAKSYISSVVPLSSSRAAPPDRGK
eukprot:8039630-Pyramimonas_sp.AAC.1